MCIDRLFFYDILLWAIGVNPIVSPDNVGAPYMDKEGGFNSLMLEIHYNNPDRRVNVVDNTGVRFYFTTKLRPNNMFY